MWSMPIPIIKLFAVDRKRTTSYGFFLSALAAGQVGKSLADAQISVQAYPTAASRPSASGVLRSR